MHGQLADAFVVDAGPSGFGDEGSGSAGRTSNLASAGAQDPGGEPLAVLFERRAAAVLVQR